MRRHVSGAAICTRLRFGTARSAGSAICAAPFNGNQRRLRAAERAAVSLHLISASSPQDFAFRRKVVQFDIGGEYSPRREMVFAEIQVNNRHMSPAEMFLSSANIEARVHPTMFEKHFQCPVFPSAAICLHDPHWKRPHFQYSVFAHVAVQQRLNLLVSFSFFGLKNCKTGDQNFRCRRQISNCISTTRATKRFVCACTLLCS